MHNNYIIFNGINSNELDGLIISELPSITRAKMRTEVTTIDGKDGSIVKELGYESYSRTIKIGLNTKANIDEISNYFTGKGKMIFSNEPDKIYDCQFLDKVDYERLLRFKKANVKVYVQPYKYLVEEASFIFETKDLKSVKVGNQGFEESKPIITLYGTGRIELIVNDVSICSVDMVDDHIIIDSLDQEAYYKNKDTLKNRQMTGNFPIFKHGINEIKWTGNLTKIKVEPKSRWV